MPYLEVMDTRIYYEVEGEGVPMLLVHGAAQCTLSWRFITPFLTGRFRTIAIDLPGHGKSDRAPGGVIKTAQEYAAYINAIVDALHVGEVVMVGHSMSGGNILQAGINRPDQVLAVIPLDGAGSTLKKAVSYSQDLMELITVNPYDYWETNFMALCSPATLPDRRQLIALEALRSSADVILGDLAAYTSLDIIDSLRRADFPILLITGADDWSCTPENVVNTFELLEGPKAMEVLDGVGHFPHMEAPEAVAGAIKKLMNEVVGL